MGTWTQYVYGHWLDTYVHPKAIELSQGKESASDCRHLGGYCEDSHDVYTNLCEVRIQHLK